MLAKVTYAVYINGMMAEVNSHVSVLADDKMLRKAARKEDCRTPQQNLGQDMGMESKIENRIQPL